MSTYITFASIMKNSNSRILNDFDLLILALKFLGWNFENFWLNLAWWEIENAKWRFEVRSWVFHDRIDNNHQWRDPPRWNPDEMRLKVLSGIISAWYSRWTRLISELEKSQNLNWNILHLVLTIDLNFELGQAVLLEVDLGIFRKNLKTVTIWFDREFDFQSGRPWQSGPDLWIFEVSYKPLSTSAHDNLPWSVNVWDRLSSDPNFLFYFAKWPILKWVIKQR